MLITSILALLFFFVHSSVTAQTIQWVWTGAVTFDSAVVTVRLQSSHTVVAAKAKSQQNHQSVINGREINNTLQGYKRFIFENLAPDTKYQVTFSTQSKDTHGIVTWNRDTHVSKLTTPKLPGTPFNFTFLAASCADNSSDSTIFTAMKNIDPLFFMHTGDIHYGNINRDDIEAYQYMLDTVFSSKRQSALYSAVPMFYMWDDHDFGPNNSDGETPGRNAALKLYNGVVPHFPLAAYQSDTWKSLPRPPSVYYRFTMGRIRFLVTDLRSGRVTGSHVLSDQQLSWLFHELNVAGLEIEASTLAAVVWVSTMPWVSDRVKWGAYDQQREIAEHVESVAQLRGRIFMIAGDAHMLGFDDGTYSPGGIPVFHAAALDAKATSKGGPYSHGIFPGRGQFGHIQVVDHGAGAKPDVCIEFTGYRMLFGPFSNRWANRIWATLQRTFGTLGSEEEPSYIKMIQYNTCNPPKHHQVYHPSPIWIEKSWKRLKRVLEKSLATSWVLVVVDESTESMIMMMEGLDTVSLLTASALIISAVTKRWRSFALITLTKLILVTTSSEQLMSTMVVLLWLVWYFPLPIFLLIITCISTYAVAAVQFHTTQSLFILVVVCLATLWVLMSKPHSYNKLM